MLNGLIRHNACVFQKKMLTLLLKHMAAEGIEKQHREYHVHFWCDLEIQSGTYFLPLSLMWDATLLLRTLHLPKSYQTTWKKTSPTKINKNKTKHASSLSVSCCQGVPHSGIFLFLPH